MPDIENGNMDTIHEHIPSTAVEAIDIEDIEYVDVVLARLRYISIGV